MNSGSLSGYEGFLDAYSSELLRWNRRINLVSRQDTENLLQDLFRQCVGGAEALWEDLTERGWAPADEVVYFDLGSGGGIPGVIWNEVFSRQTHSVDSWMVEPREKRAWFLERLAGIAQFAPFSVLEGRWGEKEATIGGQAEDPLIVISLKALHLTDPEVLDGLTRTMPGLMGGRIAIARYYPADQVLDSDLRDKLQTPVAGQAVDPGDRGAAAIDFRVLSWAEPGPREASLVLSLYSFPGA